MSKKLFENTAKILPEFIKNAIGYLKDNFDKNGQELLENTNGTFGLILKIFSKPLIDKYFDGLSNKKLENFGYLTYLKSGIVQASESIEEIKDALNDDLSASVIFEVVNNSMNQELMSFNTEDAILIFQPKYHPAIIYVKKNYERILVELNVDSNSIKAFLKHFNENIESRVVKEFGEDYNKHLDKTKLFHFKENETKLLYEIIQGGKIGFKDTENLKYEETFAEWKTVSVLRENERLPVRDEEYDTFEKKLKPINQLIENFFNRCPDNHLDEILFVIADFGKGKSVFMRHYAAEMAKQYLQTSEGYFPIYFNLRNYSKFSSETRLGVLGDYLESEYSIKIDDDYFQNKKYIFLIDSLDESGELSKRAIDKVINSIKSIQGIDKTKYRTNKIIITSRPFDEGLSHQLSDHQPYSIKNKENRDIPCFINMYGFTKSQFNDWLDETLKSHPNIVDLNANGFAKKIIDSIKTGERIDIYQELLKNETLSRSELRRPIFAYMIYQLIINNVDFIEVGKLGVYLSFLNLLTKEAKHIHDSNYKVNLYEELEFRNILHATSSLWIFERHRGKQGMLKKADICRVLEGKLISENDNEVLEKFKGNGFTEIQFLSHSYFGENDNVLHFQHQSFAEILLAEYYLKVFIKYALDEDADIEEARAKLAIGEPTEQTILFLKEMLELLKATSVNSTSKTIIEKRKLLFPLMASLSIRKHNRLFCNTIHFSWFNKFNIGENQIEYPQDSLIEWCIDQAAIDKIINLAAKILNSKVFYLPIQASLKTALFDSEVLEVNAFSKSNLLQGFDKWLALIVGNHLYNNFSDVENPKLFNSAYKINFYFLFDMIGAWNYASGESCPHWGKQLFKGIDMSENTSQLGLSHFNFDGIDFSYSLFKNIRSWGTNWCRTTLNFCSFHYVSFITSLFLEAVINNIKDIKEIQMMNCQATTSGFLLLEGLRTHNLETVVNNKRYNQYRYNPYINHFDIYDTDVFNTCSGFIVYGLKNSLFTLLQLKKWFAFENEEIKKEFFKKLDSLKIYEVKKRQPRKNNNI